MNTEHSSDPQPEAGQRDPHKGRGEPAGESEAVQKGGKKPAQRQAERDWENSAKESGE